MSHPLSNAKTEIIIRETRAEHYLRDFTTFVMIAGLAGLGWWIGSTAMEWIGGLIGLMFVISRAAAVAGKSTYRTVEQARVALDRIEKEMRYER